MSYLVINGYPIPIERDAGDQSDDSTGYTGRGVNGHLQRSQDYLKRKWRFRTTWVNLWEAQSLGQWIEGRGHHFSFDVTTHSDNGKGGWTGPIGVVSVETPKFGDNYANVTASMSASVEFGPHYVDAWTVAYWTLVGGIWQHRIETSDGRKWQDGIPMAYAWSIDMAAGVLTLEDGDYDDLVVFPFKITDDMGDYWPKDQAYSEVPYLIASGDAIGRSAYVQGVSTAITHTEGMLRGDFEPLGKLSFELAEY